MTGTPAPFTASAKLPLFINYFIHISIHYQKLFIFFRYILYLAGFPRDFNNPVAAAAQKLCYLVFCHCRVRAYTLEVFAPVPVDHPLHPAGFGWRPRFPVGRVSCRTEQRCQISSGRVPPCDHTIPVNMVLRGMRPQPAYRRLAVLYLGGELVILAQAIIHAGHDVALLRPRQRNTAVLAALFPRASVDPHYQLERSVAFGRNVNIKLLALMAASTYARSLKTFKPAEYG